MKQNDKDKKFHYCVLYTQVLKQWEVTTVLKKALPEGKGTVFYPCTELWRHDRKETEIRALFPGYIFVRSDMELEELHHFIRDHRRDVVSFIKELRISEKKISGGDHAEKPDGTNEYKYILMDLKEDEAEFLDFLLTCRENDMDGDAGGDLQCRNGAGKNDERVAVKHKIPEEGILRMSYGYREGGKYVVMKGPLKAYQDRIINVNIHDRKAFLDITVNGHAVRAGFEVRPKRYWFPDDRDAPMVLHDGTEVNLEKLRNMMMGLKEKDKHR